MNHKLQIKIVRTLGHAIGLLQGYGDHDVTELSKQLDEIMQEFMKDE